MRRLIAFTATGVLLAGQALSATPAAPKLVSTYQDWTVYTVDDKNGTVCYAASEPKKQDGNFKKRDRPHVIVAKLPGAEPNEQVSVQPGYAFKKSSDAEVAVDGQKFHLFSQGEHAWTNSPKEDQTLIDAMRKGSSLTVKATSTRDSWSLDSYSLTGFTAAYKSMQDACKRS